MDWFAVSTLGTWPGTGHTAAAVASFAVSYGLLGTSPDFSTALAGMYHGLFGVGMGMVMR